MRTLAEMSRWLRLFSRWLTESTIAWSVILIVAAACALVLAIPTEQSIRWVGTALQVLGTAAVAYDIYRALREFDQPGFIARLRTWIAGFPRWRPKPITGSANIVLGGAVSSASGFVTFVPDATTSLPVRLAALEREVQAIQRVVEETSTGLKHAIMTLRQEIAAESAARTSSLSALNQRLEKLHVDSLDWAAAGVFLVLIGTVASGFSPEIGLYLGP